MAGIVAMRSQDRQRGHAVEGQPSKPKLWRRSRRRILIRILIFLILVPVVLYVSLPWIIPDEYLEHLVEQQLTEDLGRQVAISRITLGWRSGMRVHTVAVVNMDSTLRPLLTVDMIEMEFAPISLFIKKRIGYVKINKPTFYMSTDHPPSLRLDKFMGGKQALEIGSLSIADGQLTIVDPVRQRSGELLFNLSSHIDRAAGQMSWHFDAHDRGVGGRGTLVSSGWVRSPEIAGHVAAAEGRFDTNAENLDLWTLGCMARILRMKKLSPLAIGEIEGVAAGELRGHITSKGFNADLDVQLKALTVVAESGRTIARSSDTRVAGSLQYDPYNGIAEISHLSWDLPGCKLQGEVTARLAPPKQPVVERAQVRGAVELDVLRELVPELDARLGDAFTLVGPQDFSLNYFHIGQTDRFEFDAAGDSCHWRFAAPGAEGGVVWIDKPAGVTGRMAAQIEYDRATGSMSVSEIVSKLGSSRIDALLDVPEWLHVDHLGGLVDRWQRNRLEVAVTLSDPEELADLAPVLSSLTHGVQLDGSMQLKMKLQPRSKGARLDLQLELPEDSGLKIRLPAEEVTLAEVPVGLGAAVSFAADIAEDGLRFDNLAIDASAGTAGFVLKQVSGQIRLEKGDDRGQRMDLDFHGAMRISQIEQWLTLVRPLMSVAAANVPLQRRSEMLAGDAEMDLIVKVGLGAARLRAVLLAEDLAVDLFPAFVKKRGRPAVMRADYLWDGSPNAKGIRLDLEVSIPAVQLSWWLEADRPDEPLNATVRSELNLRVVDLDAAITHFPRFTAIDPIDAEGPIHLTFSTEGTRREGRGQVYFSATEAMIRHKGDLSFEKPQGVDLMAEAIWGYENFEKDNKEYQQLSFETARGQLGDMGITGTGQMVGLRREEIQDGFELAATWPLALLRVQNLDFAIEAVIQHDGVLADVFPDFHRWHHDYQLQGQTQLSIHTTAHRGKLIVAGSVDMDQAKLKMDGLIDKLTGTPLRLDFVVATSGDLRNWELRALNATADKSEIQLGGKITLELDARNWPQRVERYKLSGEVNLPDMSAASCLLPALAEYMPAGTIAATVNLEGAGPTYDWSAGHLVPDSHEFRLDDSAITFSDFEFVWAGEGGDGLDVSIDGDVRFFADQLRAEQLAVSCGESTFAISAAFEQIPDSPTGRVTLVAEQFNLPQLIEALGNPDEESDPDMLRSKVMDAAAVIAASDIDGELRFDRLISRDAKTLQIMEFDAFAAPFSLHEGKAQIVYSCALNGGTVTGKVDTTLTDAAPRVRVEQEIKDIYVDGSILPLIEEFFPDTTAAYLSQRKDIELNLFTRADTPNPPLGSTITWLRDGRVRGPAGPDWMTRMFPKLNTFDYHFKEMTAYSQFHSDGKADNTMLFTGKKNWNIYMKGSTKLNGELNYDIGVDLLGGAARKPSNNGKILLMRVEGKIEDRKYVERKTRYPRLDENLKHFIQANPLYVLMRSRMGAREDEVDWDALQQPVDPTLTDDAPAPPKMEFEEATGD